MNVSHNTLHRNNDRHRNYLISWSTNKVILRNYEGVITTYQMPDRYEHTACDLNCQNCKLQLKLNSEESECKPIGISKLLCDYEETITLVPENLEREQRNGSEEG